MYELATLDADERNHDAALVFAGLQNRGPDVGAIAVQGLASLFNNTVGLRWPGRDKGFDIRADCCSCLRVDCCSTMCGPYHTVPSAGHRSQLQTCMTIVCWMFPCQHLVVTGSWAPC